MYDLTADIRVGNGNPKWTSTTDIKHTDRQYTDDESSINGSMDWQSEDESEQFPDMERIEEFMIKANILYLDAFFEHTMERYRTQRSKIRRFCDV